MAISLRAVGTYVSGTANLTPGIPTGAASGDMMLCFYGTKPYSDAPTINNSWIDLGNATDGTVAAGIDVGSMQIRIFYKEHTGSETDPTITNSTNNVSGAVIIVFQKDTGNAWATPVGAGGGDATAGTAFSVTASTDPGITTNDMLVGYAAIRSDAGTQSAITITATGISVGAFTESPTADLATASGGDMAMSGGYVLVSSGTSSAAPVYASTLAAAHTGSAYIVRLRQTAVSSFTITPTGNIVFSGAPIIGHGRWFSATGSILFSGTVSAILSRIMIPVGNIGFSGTVSLIKEKVLLPLGNVSFSGGASLVFSEAATSICTKRVMTNIGG